MPSALGSAWRWTAASVLALYGCSTRSSAPADTQPLAANTSGASAATARAAVGQAFAMDAAGRFHGAHRRSQLTSTIDGTGARLASARGDWRLQLRVTRVGRDGAMQTLGPAVSTFLAGDRLELARGGGVVEWFADRDGAFEHGVDLARRPDGAGSLWIDLATTGLVAHRLGARAIELRDADGARVLRYVGLSVVDADGLAVPASFVERDGAASISVQDAGARYPLKVDPLVWGAEQAELAASDGATSDGFGASVALEGSTALIGAPGKYSAKGAVYVFVLGASGWTQQAELTASDSTSGDLFGESVSLSGGVALIGASHNLKLKGAAYVFTQSGTTWTQQAKLMASDAAMGDYFGSSVALDGTTALVGAPYRNHSNGGAYVFTQSGSTWAQQTMLTYSLRARAGARVALHGGSALLGAPDDNGTIGSACIFSGTSWATSNVLNPSDGAVNDHFGSAVAFSGSTVAIGAPDKNGQTGAVYVFQQSGSSWKQAPALTGTGGVANDLFGESVALDGTSLLVGAVGVASGKGASYVFSSSGTAWTQTAKLVASDGASNDAFGIALALSGSTAVIGANQRALSTGAAYAFAPGHPDGDPCTSTMGYCDSGFCVDGVCCSTSKCDACATCAGATPGACAPNAAGTAVASCGAYLCDGTRQTCPTSCASSASCAAGTTCDATSAQCVPTAMSDAGGDGGLDAYEAGAPTGDGGSHAPGGVTGAVSSCRSDADCKSPTASHCVDGVCCDGPCTNTCASCTLPGSPGVCSLVTAGTDPRGQCGRIGSCVSTCDGRGACVPAFAGTQCAPSKCTGPSAGEGPGLCSADLTTCETDVATPFDCSPYACSPSFGACLLQCATSGDCAPGFDCDLSRSPGACVPMSPARSGGCATSRRGASAPESAWAWSLLAASLAHRASRRRRRAR
jgi:hypothetical protein